MATQIQEKGMSFEIKSVVVKIEVEKILPTKKQGEDLQTRLAKENVDIMKHYIEPWNPLLDTIYGEMAM